MKFGRIRVLPLVLTCLVSALVAINGGLFIANGVELSSQQTISSERCDIINCEEFERKLVEAEEARKAAARGFIYLTFDDGPGEFTAELLDILAKNSIKATFFVTMRGDDELITRIFNEGHAVGVHTASHRYDLIYQNAATYWADAGMVAERITRLTGETPNLLRFPGGSSNTVSRKYDNGTKVMSILTTEAGALGYTYFDWNVDSKDAGGARTTEEVVANVTSALNHDGDFVVLQHDIKDYSVRAVAEIIEYGFSNGYYFDRLSVNSFTAHHRVNN